MTPLKREEEAPDAGPELTDRQVREAARISLIKAAVACGVAELTLRLYEQNRTSVKSPQKRAALDAYYAGLRTKTCRCCASVGTGRA